MQNARLTIYASDFQAFTAAIGRFNRRTKAVNAKLKKPKYEVVQRCPVTHVGRTVTVEVLVKDRSKVLWQELSEILDRFQSHVAKCDRPEAQAPAKPVSSPVAAVSRQWGLWVPCADEAAARAAAGFLAVIAKVGTPQVECRG